jgi:hypothetical protein
MTALRGPDVKVVARDLLWNVKLIGTKVPEIEKGLFGYKRAHVFIHIINIICNILRQMKTFAFISVPFCFYDRYVFFNEVKYLYG